MLDELLRDSNPYVKSYKIMHEDEQEEIKRSEKEIKDREIV